MEENWPVVTVKVPEGTSQEQWEIFCALAGEYASEGYIESGAQETGAPVSADFAFPNAGPQGQEALAEARQNFEQLAGTYLKGEGLQITARLVQDEKWTERWREFYFPTIISPTLVVGPPDAKMPAEAEPGAIYIPIELGSAFGTGGHASTKGALVVLEKKLRGEMQGAALLLDLGTGTGVLSFAAIKLGCGNAVGIDADHHAEPNFRWNAELNGVKESVYFVMGRTVEEALAEADRHGLGQPSLITCNMISRDFDPLLEPMRRLVGRPVILSGFLREEADEVRKRLKDSGWRAEEEIWIDDWGTWWCTPV